MALVIEGSGKAGAWHAPLRRRHDRSSPHDAVIALLPEFAAALASRPSLETITRLTYDTLCPLGAAGCAVLSVDTDGHTRELATAGVSDAAVADLEPMVLEASSPILAALSKHQTLWLENRAKVARLFPSFAALAVPWQSYVAAPLVHEGTTTGAIAIPFATAHRFSPVERVTIRSVLALIAHAMARPAESGNGDPRWAPRLHPLLERIADGVIVVDVNSDRIVYVNPAMAALTGIPADQLLSMHRDALVENLQTRWHNRRRPTTDEIVRESTVGVVCCTITSARGERHDLELHHSEVDADGYRMTVLIDVTDRRSAARHAEVLEEAVWTERDRLARDLHDGVVQSVFATSLTLAAAALRAPVPLRLHIEEAIDGLDGVVQQLRTTVFGLTRPRSTTGGADDLIRTLAGKASRSLGFEPRVECTGDIDRLTDPELLGHLVLAAREALSNVARHAHATAVDVTLAVDGDIVSLVVADNGRGFDAHHRLGDGVGNLQQRAAECGGACTIASGPAGGATVTWSAPVGGAVSPAMPISPDTNG